MLFRAYHFIYLLHIELLTVPVLRIIIISKGKYKTKSSVTVGAGILQCWM